MEHSDAILLVARLRASYPRATMGEAAVEVYARAILDLGFEEVDAAIDLLVSREKYLPSVAELRLAVGSIQQAGRGFSERQEGEWQRALRRRDERGMTSDLAVALSVREDQLGITSAMAMEGAAAGMLNDSEWERLYAAYTARAREPWERMSSKGKAADDRPIKATEDEIVSKHEAAVRVRLEAEKAEAKTRAKAKAKAGGGA